MRALCVNDKRNKGLSGETNNNKGISDNDRKKIDTLKKGIFCLRINILYLRLKTAINKRVTC